MDKELREEIINTLYHFAQDNLNVRGEAYVNEIWQVDTMRSLIKDGIPLNVLRSGGAPVMLVSNWLALGIDMLCRIDKTTSHSLPPNDYPREAIFKIKEAFNNKNLDSFFDWCDHKILKPLGFTPVEMIHLYAAIELCCMRLCQEIYGITIQRCFSKPYNY